MHDHTDQIFYDVKKRGDKWAVVSQVMTCMGSKPAENFIVENVSKKWCEGFAAALTAIENRRTPDKLPPPFDWQKVVRELVSEEKD